MLEFIPKHTLILTHRNFNMLELQRLNLTFLIVPHPLLQGFGSAGQAKLWVKLLTWNEILAFGLVLSEQHHNANHWSCHYFFFLFWKKDLCKIFLSNEKEPRDHELSMQFFFSGSTTHYFWILSMKRVFLLLSDGKNLVFITWNLVWNWKSLRYMLF